MEQQVRGGASVRSSELLVEMSNSRSPTDSNTARRVRRKPNVTRACDTCRKKRTKCDGAPSCSTCQLHEIPCVYSHEHDGRRTASKQYVQALEHRVKQLETQLQRSNARIPESTNDSDFQQLLAHSLGSLSDDDGGSDPLPDMSDFTGEDSGDKIGALRVFGPGDIAHYGPSSAYMHLTGEGASAAVEGEEQPATPIYRLCDIEWSTIKWFRSLPSGIRISRQVHSDLLESFFRHLNWWCCWCNEAAFLHGLVRAAEIIDDSAVPPHVIRSTHYSPLLHNVILALAALNSPETIPPDHGDPKAIMASLASHATSMIEAEMLRPMTTTARGLMLLGSYQFHNTQRHLGWCYAGMGVRLAQALGLNTDCRDLVEKGVLSAASLYHRDKTFWTIHIQDSLWSFNVGRAPAINVEDYQTPLPVPRKEDDEEPWIAATSGSRHPEVPEMASGRRAGWRSSCLTWTSMLIKIANDVHRSLYRVRQPAPNAKADIISKLEVALEEWLVELIPPLRLEAWRGEDMPPHILNMHSVFHYVRILLHRPACFNFRTGEESRAISLKACETAARQILQLFGDCKSLRYSTTTLPNIAFTAGTTFLLIAAHNNLPATGMREELRRVDQCLGFLRQMSWPAAGVAADILQRMKTEWVPNEAHLADSDNTLAIAKIKSQLTNLSGTDSIEALKDPESDLAKLLRSIGWQPPTVEAPPTPVSAPGFDGGAASNSLDSYALHPDLELAAYDVEGTSREVCNSLEQPFWGVNMSMEDYVSSDLSGFASFFGDYGSPFTQT